MRRKIKITKNDLSTGCLVMLRNGDVKFVVRGLGGKTLFLGYNSNSYLSSYGNDLKYNINRRPIEQMLAYDIMAVSYSIPKYRCQVKNWNEDVLRAHLMWERVEPKPEPKPKPGFNIELKVRGIDYAIPTEVMDLALGVVKNYVKTRKEFKDEKDS